MGLIGGRRRASRSALWIVLSLVALSVVPGRAAAVVGGTAVSQPTFESDWPFAVFIDTDSGNCTGVLVAPRTVLTAAHCFDGVSTFEVKTGSTAKASGTVVAVDDHVIHPSYDGTAGDPDDIAFIRLSSAAPAPAQPIRPITATEASTLGSTFDGETAGYGDTAVGISSSTLNEGAVHVEPGTGFGVPSTFYASQGAADVCSGDSGGPLVTDLPSGERVVVAIASFGDAACTDFSAFVKLASYIDFFEDQISYPFLEVEATPSSGAAPLVVTFDIVPTANGAELDGPFILDPGDNRPSETSANPTFTHTYTAPGTYSAMGCGANSAGDRQCAYADVTVSGTGTGPTVEGTATPNQGTSPLNVTFDLSGSTDDGTIVSYTLDPGDGSASVTQFGDPTFDHQYTGSPRLFNPRISATDDDGYENVRALPVRLVSSTSDNQDPIVVAVVSPTQGEFPLHVTFDLTQSTDNVGIASYGMYPGVGPDVFENTTGLFTYTYTSPGQFTASLFAADLSGRAAQDLVDIEVTIPPGASPDVTVADAKVREGDRGTKQMTFTLTRTGDLTRTSSVRVVTVAGTAKEGKDYIYTEAVLGFPVGEDTATYEVQIRGDRRRERKETFTFALNSIDNADIIDDVATGKIVDND